MSIYQRSMMSQGQRQKRIVDVDVILNQTQKIQSAASLIKLVTARIGTMESMTILVGEKIQAHAVFSILQRITCQPHWQPLKHCQQSQKRLTQEVLVLHVKLASMRLKELKANQRLTKLVEKSRLMYAADPQNKKTPTPLQTERQRSTRKARNATRFQPMEVVAVEMPDFTEIIT